MKRPRSQGKEGLGEEINVGIRAFKSFCKYQGIKKVMHMPKTRIHAQKRSEKTRLSHLGSSGSIQAESENKGRAV